MVELQANCRQTDAKMVELVKVYASQCDDYDDLFSLIEAGGQISSQLHITHWELQAQLEQGLVESLRRRFGKKVTEKPSQI